MSDAQHQHLHQHSLRVILDNQQPSGAYLACPTMPDYQFSWYRDGAYIAYALSVDGQTVGIQHGGSMAAQWESANRFHNWCAEMIINREERVERSIAAAQRGEKPDPRDLLNARYRADGLEGPDEWPEFQLDGLGTWIWSLKEYMRIARITPLPEAWELGVRLAARYLAALWQMPCYDCWEERGDQIHISTLGAIYAGLTAAESLVPALNFADTKATLRAFVLEKGLTPGGELAKSVGVDMVDANLLSAALPHGLLKLDDPIVKRTVERIERDLHAPNSGVHRHLDDVYYGGGAWVLLAFWLAWYYAETGDTAKARELFQWASAQADSVANLPEQVNSAMLAPDHYEPWVQQRGTIANPLLWTHAKYLLVRRYPGMLNQ